MEKDPKSLVFAPLSDAYRRLGLFEQALQVAARGVKNHPKFASGRLSLGRIFLDQKRPQDAVIHLKLASEFEPDNILAQTLLAECYLKIQKPKEALKAYKLLLYLNPNNEKALKAVKKLESLTADEYDENLFTMKSLESSLPRAKEFLQPVGEKVQIAEEPQGRRFQLDRIVSLADAYIVRNDIERAEQCLNEGTATLGEHPEIQKRLQIIQKRLMDRNQRFEVDPNSPLPSRTEQAINEKIQFLQSLLIRVQERRDAQH